MRRGLVALLVVAACNGGQGVDIEVHQGSESIDAVELWLAYDVCKLQGTTDECDGIGWPSAQLRPSGDVYTLGEDEKLVRTDVIVDGVAQLHLEATPSNSSPYIIAVVGYHGGSIAGVKMLSGLEIPTNDQAHWRIELDDVGQVTEDLTADPGDKPSRNALVWARRPSSTLPDTRGYSGCFAYQKWTGSAWETKYIVPPSDPDCDGDPPDCNPYWYDAPVNKALCVDQPNVLPNVCAVGGLRCQSETPDSSCQLQTSPLMCVGSGICAACEGSPDLVACLRAQVPATPQSTNAIVPMQACTMYANVDGPCNYDGLPSAGWIAKFGIPGGMCAPGATNDIAVLRPVSSPLSGGMQTISLNGAAIAVHAAPVATGCNIEITWQQGLLDLAVHPVIVAVNYGPSRQILIPVLLDVQKPPNAVCPTSTAPTQCLRLGDWPEQDAGDSLFQCADGG